MAENKIQPNKLEAVAALKEQFGEVTDFFFADYRGLTVEQITELRGNLRKLGAEFHVVKNNYAKIAFKQLEKEGLDGFLVGPTAIAIVKDEAGPVAKALLDFSDDAPVEVKGGFVDGNVFDTKQVEAFSKLPTKIELIQMLMGTMQAPARNLACALNDVTTKLVRTLDAVRDQKENA
ncbi:MAG: 50S ribosomal protein L10 [Spirochaetales bacterium]|nr:50S ribosomal protein L10 [Spirochaetales bacterium]